ncbi:MAG: hypothetical protein RIR62_1330, partial [Pseudomonadota bacterium]
MTVLDQSIIAEVRETLGDDIFRGFADRMLAEAVLTVPQLRSLMAAGEIEALAQLAHRSAGSAVSVGATALHARLKRIEDLARSGSPAGLGEAVAALEGDIAAARGALENLL